MRGVYTSSIDISGLSTSKTLILLEVSSSTIVEILSASVTNRSVDTNEQLEMALVRVTSKGSPTGTTITATKHENGDDTDPCTVLGNLTAEPTTYASNFVDKQGFSNLAGYRYDPVPEERPNVPPSGLIGLKLTAAPATAFDATAQIVYRVIG